MRLFEELKFESLQNKNKGKKLKRVASTGNIVLRQYNIFRSARFINRVGIVSIHKTSLPLDRSVNNDMSKILRSFMGKIMGRFLLDSFDLTGKH